MSALVDAASGTPLGPGMVGKVSSAATGGSLTVAEAIVPPGMFVPPHRHTREDEVTLVLEGVIHVVVGDEHIVAGAGSVVVKPRAVAHAFWNEGPAPARVIELVAPGTLDTYFAELFSIAMTPGLDDATRARQITEHHARHGITFLDDVEAFMARHRVPATAPPGGPGPQSGSL